MIQELGSILRGDALFLAVTGSVVNESEGQGGSLNYLVVFVTFFVGVLRTCCRWKSHAARRISIGDENESLSQSN